MVYDKKETTPATISSDTRVYFFLTLFFATDKILSNRFQQFLKHDFKSYEFFSRFVSFFQQRLSYSSIIFFSLGFEMFPNDLHICTIVQKFSTINFFFSECASRHDEFFSRVLKFFKSIHTYKFQNFLAIFF